MAMPLLAEIAGIMKACLQHAAFESPAQKTRREGRLEKFREKRDDMKYGHRRRLPEK